MTVGVLTEADVTLMQLLKEAVILIQLGGLNGFLGRRNRFDHLW
jgi:hypothetical protein